MPQRSSYVHAIGTLMCQATRDVLWDPAKDWIREQNQCAGLVLRVGSGQATYHRYDPRKKQHLITYGARMIAAKHQRSEEHTSELQSRPQLVCRLLLAK